MNKYIVELELKDTTVSGLRLMDKLYDALVDGDEASMRWCHKHVEGVFVYDQAYMKEYGIKPGELAHNNAEPDEIH